MQAGHINVAPDEDGDIVAASVPHALRPPPASHASSGAGTGGASGEAGPRRDAASDDGTGSKSLGHAGLAATGGGGGHAAGVKEGRHGGRRAQEGLPPRKGKGTGRQCMAARRIAAAATAAAAEWARVGGGGGGGGLGALYASDGVPPLRISQAAQAMVAQVGVGEFEVGG